MDKRDIIVIGASAGGVEALTTLCRGFPGDLAASIFVVQHLSPEGQSVLPKLLSRAGPMPARTPAEGEEIRQGQIYVAGPDRHLLLAPGKVLVRRGPHENRSRPAIDALFRSAALAYGPRVVGVVLTGLLDDGTEGLITIKRAGGTSVVQDPADASWPSMPRNALRRDSVDFCVPLVELAKLLTTLAAQPAGPAFRLPAEIATEVRIAEQEFTPASKAVATPGHPSILSCPQCGGVLNEIPGDAESRFRCQIGHAFTAAALADANDEELERALAIAVRTHRDRLKLYRQMEASAQAAQHERSAKRWGEVAQEAEHLAEVLEAAMSALRKPVLA